VVRLLGRLAHGYGGVAVWLDDAKEARALAQQLEARWALRSVAGEQKQDANALLQAGTLDEALRRALDEPHAPWNDLAVQHCVESLGGRVAEWR
jgi:hypothetical protein